jgi:hypothetical protein
LGYCLDRPDAIGSVAGPTVGGDDLDRTAKLPADEFIRRFLLHNLLKGFHRIRHYGLLASGTRRDNLERARHLLAVAPPVNDDTPVGPPDARPPCTCCGGRMVVIETLECRYQPRAPPFSTASSGRQAS